MKSVVDESGANTEFGFVGGAGGGALVLDPAAAGRASTSALASSVATAIGANQQQQHGGAAAVASLSSSSASSTNTSSSAATTSMLQTAASHESFCNNTHDMLMFVLSLLSAMLQLYVIVQAVKHIRRRTSDKCMHVFLLSMTVADFLLTALCYPVELAPRAGLITAFPRVVAASMHLIVWVGLIVSSLSLIFLNVDKLFFFRFPLSYEKFFNRAKAIGLSACCWASASAFVLFAWFTNSFHCVDEDCITLAIFPNRLYIYLPFVISVGVIPTVTSLIVAVYIMKIVSAHRRQMNLQQQPAMLLFSARTELEDEHTPIVAPQQHNNNNNQAQASPTNGNANAKLRAQKSSGGSFSAAVPAAADGAAEANGAGGRRTSPSSHGGAGAHHRSHSLFSAKMRTFYFIFMTTVFTAVTLLPYRFAGLYRSLNPQQRSDCLTVFLYWIMMYMIYLNSIVNPLLTVTVLPRYRINIEDVVGTLRKLRAFLCRRDPLNDGFGKLHHSTAFHHPRNGTITITNNNNNEYVNPVAVRHRSMGL